MIYGVSVVASAHSTGLKILLRKLPQANKPPRHFNGGLAELKIKVHFLCQTGQCYCCAQNFCVSSHVKANIKNILPIQSASVTLVWQKYFVGAICQRPHHGQSLGCTWAASQPPRCRCDGHGPLTRYVQLRMRRECRERCPPPPTSKETDS